MAVLHWITDPKPLGAAIRPAVVGGIFPFGKQALVKKSMLRPDGACPVMTVC
jgi:hypothetical protein